MASLAALGAALMVAGARGLLTQRALWVGLVAFALLTVIADVLLTAFGVYGYDGHFNAGLLIGRMPVEDLAYALALYLVAATAWSWGDDNAR